MFKPPGDCPMCGHFVAAGKLACPDCGSDKRSGWSDNASVADLDLPDDESFDYEEFVRKEFQPSQPQSRVHRFWIVLAILLLAVICLGFLAGFRW